MSDLTGLKESIDALRLDVRDLVTSLNMFATHADVEVELSKRVKQVERRSKIRLGLTSLLVGAVLLLFYSNVKVEQEFIDRLCQEVQNVDQILISILESSQNSEINDLLSPQQETTRRLRLQRQIDSIRTVRC